MGAKTLGEQMGIEEEDAACYIESFKARYAGETGAGVKGHCQGPGSNDVSVPQGTLG